MTYILPDLDIDVKNRDDLLNHFKHISASKITNTIQPHLVGEYFCDIPTDLITNQASIDYKTAEEEYGFIKIDILHNTEYDNYKSRTDMFETLNKPIIWDNLYKEQFIKKLPHIGNYYTLINQLPKIKSVENLARFIAIIRPAKKYLIDRLLSTKNWDSIDNDIWTKESDGYQFKHSHAISYAMLITLALNRLSYDKQ